MNKKIIDNIINKGDMNEIYYLLVNNEISISELKQFDFLIDFRGTNKYDEIINYLKNKLNTEISLKYIKEIEIINKIFLECAKLQNAINSVPPKLVLPLMLYWGSIKIDEYASLKAEKFFKKYNADMITSYEKNTDMVIQAIKSLIYNKKIFDGSKFIYTLHNLNIFYSKYKYQRIIVKYIIDSYNASYWFEKYEYWKKGIYDIFIIDNNSIKLVILDKELLAENTNHKIKEKIGRTQYESHAIGDYFFVKNFINSSLNLDPIEFISQSVLDKHFYCKSKDILIENVKVKDWLKAYYTLYKLSQIDVDKIKSRSLIFNLFLDSTRCKTKEKWIKIFVKNGIPIESAKIIFERLVFGKGATDLYDYPFIPINNKYTISRTITKWMLPARSLISRFNSKDINIDIKGHNFEKTIYSFLDMFNIPYIQIHNKVNGNEYECDAVFYLNNTFVFCECKSRTGHKLETVNSSKYVDDANQLNRISKFYKDNMNLIFDAFETKGIKIKDKKFYDIKNIVIHSGSVDGVIIKDDVYIMDYESFIMPFDRGSNFEDYININRLKNVFEGEITIYKIFKFYDYKFYIYDYRNKIIYNDNHMQLGSIKIHIEDYYIEDFLNKELTEREIKIHMKFILRYNGFSEYEIEEFISKLPNFT